MEPSPFFSALLRAPLPGAARAVRSAGLSTCHLAFLFPYPSLEQDILVKRFEGHWYPDEPHRGCAYRALISTVSSVDPLLLRAAETTGQRGLCESFMKVFSDVGEVNCWVAGLNEKTKRVR